MRKRRENRQFSKILSGLLKEKKIGVREAARVAGVNPSTVSAWTGGGSPEDCEAVRRLANHLGVSLSFILTGQDEARVAGGHPSVTEAFADGGALFDGFAHIRIQRLIPRSEIKAQKKNDDGEDQ